MRYPAKRDEELPKKEIPESGAIERYRPSDYYCRRGILALYLKDYPKAIALLEDAVKLDPDSPDAHKFLAAAYLLSGREAEAISEYEKACKLDPTDYSAELTLGMLYHIRGELDEAIEHYRKATNIRPESAEAYLKLGLAYASKGMPSKAVEAYREAIKIKILEKLGEL